MSPETFLLAGFGIVFGFAIVVLVLLLKSPKLEPKKRELSNWMDIAKAEGVDQRQDVILFVPKTCFVFNKTNDHPSAGRWTCVCPGLMMEADDPDAVVGRGNSLYEAYRDHLRRV